MFMHDAKSFAAAEKITLALHGLTAAAPAGAPGILAGSLVETEAGWCPVEALGRGVAVATYDGGFCRPVRIERRHLWPAVGAEMIHVPGGALDNCSDFALMPGQQVLIASDIAEAVLDRGAVLLPAGSLVGYRGISRQPLTRPVEMVSLVFASDEVVYVNTGALIHCAGDGAPALAAGLVAGCGGGAGRAGFFDRLSGDRAAALLALIVEGARSTADLVAA